MVLLCIYFVAWQTLDEYIYIYIYILIYEALSSLNLSFICANAFFLELFLSCIACLRLFLLTNNALMIVFT